MKLISTEGNKKGSVEFISIHIPKTGGRSFHAVLKQVYGDSLDRRYEKEHFFPRKGKTDRKTLDLPQGVRGIHGHLTVKQVMPIIDRDHPRVVTWVRDPVERVISNYYYFMKRIREGDVREKQKRKSDMTLLGYASQPGRQNRMSAILEGMEADDFFFIGITGRFEEDLTILCSMMGWPAVENVPHINELSSFRLHNDCATQYHDIDQSMRSAIAGMNAEDIKLYAKIKKMRGIQ